MIKIEQADREIAESVTPTRATEILPLALALHRTLATSVRADRPYPPFDRVAMDGVALKLSDWKGGERKFSILFTQKAGEPAGILKPPNSCAEVMTGAMLPEGADAVVPFERLQIQEGYVTLQNEEVAFQQNIHLRGSDCAEGATLLEAGQNLTSPRLAVAASVGATDLEVYRLPRIAIVSTGDELVAVDQTPAPYQIRSSNASALRGLFQAFGFVESSLFHIADDPRQLHRQLALILQDFDFVVLSGGVSMGKFDYVPKVLADLKVRPVFHKIAQKPGKPIWFGVGGGGQAVFGLPGNPVSSLVCARRFVVPSLRRWARLPVIPVTTVELDQELHFEKPLTWLPSVTLNAKGRARPVESNGSGDFISLGLSGGFLELPAEVSHFARGESYPFFGWGPSAP